MWFAKMFGLSWPCYARFIQHPRSSLSSWMEPNPKTPNRELVGFLWLQSLLHHMTISPLLFVPIFFYRYKTEIALEMKAVWQDFDLGKEKCSFQALSAPAIQEDICSDRLGVRRKTRASRNGTEDSLWEKGPEFTN